MQAANFFDVRTKLRPLPFIMFSILLLLGFSFAGQSQNVTLEGKNVSLEKMLRSIEKQTEYKFFYKPDLLSTAKKVTINVKDMSLQKALDFLFADQPVTWRIYGKIITLKLKPASGTKEVEVNSDELRLMELTGTVFDVLLNIPLEGVSVTVAATGKGTFTNAQGKYAIGNIEPSSSLLFSMIGYKTVRVPVADLGAFALVKMEQTSNELDKVMVKAYGTTSQRLTTSAITRINGEEIKKVPVMNPLLALQGRVPGLLITKTSGRANAPLKISLNGRTSLSPDVLSEPLIVIDGNPITISDIGLAGTAGGFSRGIIQGGSHSGGQSPLYGMNPNDIESIEVLQDAGATAQYGARAANGVILITTKKGKSGKTSFSAEINHNVQNAVRVLKLPNTKEYLQIRREAFRNDGITPKPYNAPDLLIWDTTRYTNWQEELLSAGSGTSVKAGLSGGDLRTTFRISAGFDKTKEMNSPSGSNQTGTINANINHSSNNRKFTVSLSAGYRYTQLNVIPAFSDFDLPPNAPPIFNSKGDLNFTEWNEGALAGGSVNFPFGSLLQINLMKSKAITGSLVISYELMDNLKLSTRLGYSGTQGLSEHFLPIASQNPLDYPTGSAFFSQTDNDNWNIEPTLRYSRYVSKGRLDIQVGGSTQKAVTKLDGMNGFGYDSDELIRSINDAPFIQVSKRIGIIRNAAAFASINYYWDNKYSLEMSARRDGSSRFAPGKQYGNFGAVGLAWNASEESWVKKILPSWFSFLKFSSSFGLTGNYGGRDYQYLSRWSGAAINNSYAQFPEYNGIRPFNPIQAVNQQFKWSSNKMLRVGAQIGFLDDRITVRMDYSQSRNKNEVLDIPTPVMSGFKTVTANWPALMGNSVWSGSIDATLVRTKDFTWSASFNISTDKNKLIAYPGLEFSPYFQKYRIGQSPNMRYLFHYTGIDPQTGTYAFADHNKDGAVKGNSNVIPGTVDDDQYIALDLTPDYTGGLNSQFRYKNFSLSLVFDFIKRIGPRPYTGAIPGGMQNSYLPADLYNNRWQKPGDKAIYPRFTTLGNTSFFDQSDGAYGDVSYFRLNNLFFSYSLPDKWIKRAGLQSCGISLSANNLFFITPYEGLDPEMLNPTVSPSTRIINCSLWLNF